MGLLEDLYQIGDGVRGTVEDVPSFVENVMTGDVHGTMTDGRNIIGDVTGVAQGLQNLGVSLGEVPKRYLGTAAKLADSKILSAAQLLIDGEKALTGSGDPETGMGYKDSAKRLDGAVYTLVHSTPADDQWNGAAAEAYATANDEHRRRVSDVQVADAEIARILSEEATQVVRTREALDDASQYLYDFGLSTAWMNFVPPLIPAKATLDLGASAAALGWTANSMEDLVQKSLQSAAQIWDAKKLYNEALIAIAKHKSDPNVPAEVRGPCGTLTSQEEDLGELPTRLSESEIYRVPDIEREWGPPTTPYSTAPSSSGPAPTAGSPVPVMPAPRPPITPPAASTSNVPTTPAAAQAPTARPPAAPISRAAGPIDSATGATTSETAPIALDTTYDRQTRTR